VSLFHGEVTKNKILCHISYPSHTLQPLIPVQEIKVQDIKACDITGVKRPLPGSLVTGSSLSILSFLSLLEMPLR